MELLHPGVYIQEVPSGLRTIEGVSTSTASFIGKAQMGPVDRAVLITRFTEFEATFGGFLSDSWLAHSVFQFFNNGGKKCYVVRVVGQGARAGSITLKDRRTTPGRTLEVRASNPGAWSNSLDLVVTNGTLDPDNEFNLAVFRDRSTETPPQPPQLLESFENVSMNESAANYVEKVVAANGRSITVLVDAANRGNAAAGASRSGRLPTGDVALALNLVAGVPNGATETAGSAGPPATAGRSRSGDNPSTNPPADQRRLMINLDHDGAQEIVLPPTAATGADIAAAIQAAVRALTANDPARQRAYTDFTCTFDTSGAAPFYQLTSGSAGTSSSVSVTGGAVPFENAALLLRLGTANGGTETAGAAGPPATAGESRSGPNPSTNPPAGNRRFRINLDGDGAREIVIPPGAATGADVATAIQSAVRALTANTGANQPAYNNFTCAFQTPAAPAAPFYLLTSGSTGVNSRVVATDSLVPAAAISLGAGTRRFVIEINRDGPHVVTITGPQANGAAIAAAIQAAVRAITPKRAANNAAFTGFTCSYENTSDARNPSLLLTSGITGTGSSVHVTNFANPAENAATLLRLGLTSGGVETSGGAILRPANAQSPTEYHLGDAQVSGNVDAVAFGDDGTPPGDNEHKNGLTALDTVRDVNLVAIPGVATQEVVSTGVNYCTQRGDCFFIADVNMTDDTVEEARTFLNGLTTKTSYGALYYPWLRMADPSGATPQPILVPPSGFVAGVYAKIDARRGVFKAPAGTEANVAGAVGLTADTTDVQQDFLNPIGVNVIRAFPAAGIVIWGARTLATRTDPEYRYVPVRRLAIFLEQSIYNGIQFAVFEPNDEPLWASLRLSIGAFMMQQFRAGAFQGRTANEAFFVVVDASTTTQQDIDAGIVNILVGFAPLKPAEFVVLKLTQKVAQPAA